MPAANNKPAIPNAAEYLDRALQLLEKPGPKGQPNSWIRNCEAINEEGSPVAPESEQAQAWCTIGVIKAVVHYDSNPDMAYRYCLSMLNLANPAYVATGSPNAQPMLNDDNEATSFETVRRFFQRAIAMATKMQQKAGTHGH